MGTRTFIQVAPNSTGEKMAAQQLVDGANNVDRQEILISDPSTLAAVAAVLNSSPGGTEYGLGVRQIGSVAVTGTFFQATQPVSGTFWQATQPVSIAAAVSVTQAALTKGTQGSTGVTTQDLKDAGRNQTNFFMVTPIVTTATDTLMSLTGFKSGAAVTATTTPAVVTIGKTFRIQTITISYVAIATAGTVKFTLRANIGGVVAIGSPAVANWIIGGPAAVAGVSQTVDVVVPDGLEFAAGTGIGVSMVGLSTTQVAAAVGYGMITINGYEY